MGELRRLSGECRDVTTCPGVWAIDTDDVVFVGFALEQSPVPLGPGELAIRLPKRVLRDADLR